MAKILLVEDEPTIRDAFSIILSSKGYDFDAATNGSEALDYWNKNSYSLVLLDLMMPVLDGVGFLKEAKIKDSESDTRVVVLSNLSSGESTVKAMELGAHRHEVKTSLSPSRFLKLVDEELDRLKQSI